MVEARKVLPALALLIIIVLSAVIWFYPPTGDFRVDNPFWNGMSVLGSQSGVVQLGSFSNLPSSGSGTSLILVPYEQFSDSELSELRSYVSSGGTLVLLDDYGYGNQVLTSFGLGMRFVGKPLVDPLFDYKNGQLPKITDFAALPVTANVSSVVFNHATALSGTSDATIIASSSSFSFIDENSNDQFDSGDVAGPVPVAAYVKVAKGIVVAVGDPSCLINGMISMDNNLLFINRVVDIQGGNQQVFVDQSHLPSAPLDEAKTVLATGYNVVASPLGTLSLIALALAVSLKSLLRRHDNNVKKR